MRLALLFRGTRLSWLSLAVALIALALNWVWVWGLLVLYWVVLEIGTGETFLVQRLRRADAPALYWSVLALWTFFGIYFLVAVPFG